MSGGRFERCLRFTLSPQIEGGYSNVPGDKGGPTNRGVTDATFQAAKRAGIVPRSVQTVRDLSEEHVEAIYQNFFWNPSRAHEFPAPLDLCLFDAYVNHRPRPAVKLIQAAVGVDQDGVIGPLTVDAAHQVNLVTAVERYAFSREQLYRRIVAEDQTQARFLRGWLNRVAYVKSASLLEVA